MKKTVNVLVDHGTFASASDFYPLYRWKRQLYDHGIKINIFHHLDSKIHDADVIILASRYFKLWQDITTRNKEEFDNLVSDLCSLSKTTDNLIWFDNSDGTGTTDFDIIPYVDTFLKKQVLKEKNKYTVKNKENVRIWLPSSVQSEYNRDTSYEYIACPENDLFKIKISWNIGFCDYRFSNPTIANYFSLMFPNLFGIKTAKSNFEKKDIDLHNRGNASYDNMVYSYQRNIVISQIEEIKKEFKDKNIIAQGFIKRSEYYNELRRAKIVLSPFGWGEVCYRDFEIILADSLMLKPSMDHLDTYPNVYFDNTYIKLQWDLSDLKEVISKIFSNPDMVKDITSRVKDIYVREYNDSDLFCNHFANIITKSS
jgi:hypothetical protein